MPEYRITWNGWVTKDRPWGSEQNVGDEFVVEVEDEDGARTIGWDAAYASKAMNMEVTVELVDDE